jgi:hypothetical protein
MASNIRELMMARPGMRVLVLVGASHKKPTWKRIWGRCMTCASSALDDILR